VATVVPPRERWLAARWLEVLMNYTELKTAVEDYTENTFSATDFATMTELAEQKIYNTVQLPALRKNVTGSTSANNKYLQCPGDFLSVFSMAVILADGSYEYLLDKDVNFIRQAYPTPTSTGIPRYYAIFGPRSDNPNELSFILGPTPNATFGVELHYFYYPESIVIANTSWLGDNFDSVLFNGVMVEAARFMKEEADVVTMYEQQFAQSLILLKQLGDGKNRQDAYRNGQVRVKVG
jgi:hypothetical protein